MSSNLPRLRHQIAWDGKALVVTDPDTLKNIRRPALSASTSKSMQSCAARWVGERLLRKEKEDPFAPAPLGTAAHAVLEDFFGLDGPQRTMARAELILLGKADELWILDSNDSEEVRKQTAMKKIRWIRDVKNAYQGIFISETPALVDVYGCELKIEDILIAGVPATGFIDRTETATRRGITGLLPADYKTGNMPNPAKLAQYGDDHGDQLRVYAEAIRVMLGVNPVGAKVIYTKFGKEREVDISRTKMSATLKVFADSWGRHNRYMDDASFPTKTSPLCEYCPLVNSCAVAKEAGYSASPQVAGKLPSATALGIPSLRPGITPWPLHSTRDMTVREPGRNVTFFAPEPGVQIVSDQHPEAVRELPPPAHIVHSGETRKINESEIPMASTKPMPWEEFVDGELNPGSYVASAVTTLSTMAVESLHQAGLPINGRTMKALASTYYEVVMGAQEPWTGTRNIDDPANTRLRAALFSVTRTLPQPWGQGADAWDEWVVAATKRCRGIVSTALYLHAGEFPETPWHSFADIEPAFAAAPVKAKAPARTRAAKVAAPKVAPAPQAAPEPEPIALVIEPEPVVEAPVAKPVSSDDFVFPSEEDFGDFNPAENFGF